MEVVVDGDLAEWVDIAPTWSLGPAHVVPSTQAPTSEADLSAQIWVHVDARGLWIAGDVVDDVVRLPTDPRDIIRDHAEVWIGSVPPDFGPPLATDHWEDTWDPSTACPASYEAACAAWLPLQDPWRRRLRRLFARQFVLHPTVAELWAIDAGPELQPPLTGQSVGRVVATDDGYHFEAWIAVGDFPLLADGEVRELRVLVDLVDTDDPTASQQETVVSPKPERRLGAPSTFDRLRPEAPLTLTDRAPIRQPGFFHFPGAPDQVASFGVPTISKTMARSPIDESSSSHPTFQQHSLRELPLGSVGDVNLSWALHPDGPWLRVRRDGAILNDTPGIKASYWTESSASWGDGRRFLGYSSRCASQGCRGPNGGTSVFNIAVIDLAADGAVSVTRLSLEEMELGYPVHTLTLSGDGRRITFGSNGEFSDRSMVMDDRGAWALEP